MRRSPQRSLHCPCGRPRVLARGLCAVCYTLRRQDEAYFGGLREAVLARDGYACRVCGASGRGKRSITVHHRVPGRSVLALMISLCPGLPCQGPPNPGGALPRCRLCSWSCGGSSTRMAMSRRRSTLGADLLQHLRFCSFPGELPGTMGS